MWAWLQAAWFKVRHPFQVFDIAIVRRYVDAQGRYIGELYEVKDLRTSMIGASCDNMPLDANMQAFVAAPRLSFEYSFLDPLPPATVRVGSFMPQENANVQAYVALRRFLRTRMSVHNNFVEHVLEPRNV